MKITGKIIFEKTPGRKDPWVKKQVENDYFLALQITKIDDQPVNTTNDMFIAMKNKFPQLSINEELVNGLFTNATLPPNAKDIPHITLGNFPDFRLNRSVENDIDKNKVMAALEIQDNILTFDVNGKDFELVIATKNQDLINRIQQENLVQSNNGNFNIAIAPTVGVNRDAVLNIKPSVESQKLLSEYSKKVFGKEFELWNSVSKPIPYHLTIAQTNQLTNKLELACQTISPKNDSKQLSMCPTNS
jgi:hypothetical protein